MDFSPQWSFGDSHLPRLLRIESPEPRFLGEMVADCRSVAVFDGERNEGVSVSLERGFRCQLEDLDLEVLLLAAEGDGPPQHLLRADRSVEIHWLRAALKCQRAQQPDDA